jgi:hypothetical protein
VIGHRVTVVVVSGKVTMVGGAEEYIARRRTSSDDEMYGTSIHDSSRAAALTREYDGDVPRREERPTNCESHVHGPDADEYPNATGDRDGSTPVTHQIGRAGGRPEDGA